MKRPRKPVQARRRRSQPSGQMAQRGSQTLQSHTVGALPIVNHILERTRLEEFFRDHLKADGRRTRLPTATGLIVLLKNLLFSREPIYGVGEWAERYAPDLVGLPPGGGAWLNDDRLGRCLNVLFETDVPELVLSVVRHVFQEFRLRLAELHNDSTSVTVFGAYRDAAEEGSRRGRTTLAITYGHNKDHRPDLKQLLYVLTVTEDGGVPVYFTTKSGNVTDDTTHQETWELLCEVVGHKDFLYVADCKLATMENMNYIHRHQGRFISVLPATRKEDREFRSRALAEADSVDWEWLYDITDDDGEVRDRLSVWPRETLSADGYRLWWFHSTRKVELDEAARLKQIDRAVTQLNDLRRRLTGPRTRYRQREQVQQAVGKILDETGARPWLHVGIQDWCRDHYRQTKPGRPNKNTQYVRVEIPSFDLCWEIDQDALAQQRAGDGVFPLITNVREFSALQTLQAYKRQSVIEKRFSQFKTDFAVAPVYLKSVSRIQALLCVYFFALLVQTLLERELRMAMEAQGIESLPLYPEGRACRRPTTRRLLDVFEPLQRHTLTNGTRAKTFVTDLSPLHRRILKLLGLPHKDYGR